MKRSTLILLLVLLLSVQVMAQPPVQPPQPMSNVSMHLTFAAHGDLEVLDLSFNHDASRLATSGADGMVHVWDTQNGTLLRSMSISDGEEYVVLSVEFSPNGQYIAAAADDDEVVFVWDAASGDLVVELEGDDDASTSVAFSPDSTQLAWVNDGDYMEIFDLATGEVSASLEGHKGEVFSLLYSQDGSYLLSGGDDGSVRLWDATNGAEVSVLYEDKDPIRALAYSYDGSQYAFVLDDNYVQLRDVAGVQPAIEFQGIRTHVDTLAFYPLGNFLVAGGCAENNRLLCVAGEITFWNVRQGNQIGYIPVPLTAVISLTFSADGRWMATGHANGSIAIWEVRSTMTQQ